jgi:hypothetical protein
VSVAALQPFADRCYALEADLEDCRATGRLSLLWIWGNFSIFLAEASAEAARLAVIERDMEIEVRPRREMDLKR